ncbi:MAG: thiamine phosphate synthase [Gemmatimonadales bacterium]
MLIAATMRENLAAALRLLLVTDDDALAGRDVLTVCRAAVRGGVTAVQLRLKRMGDRELLHLARQMIGELDVPVFVNDRLDIAIAAGAAGVHLGADDLPPALTRRVAPAGLAVGASVGDVAEVIRGATADYWGIGPLRTTTTKGDAGSALGLDGATALLRQAAGRPCVLIGGVLPIDVVPAIRAGFAGIAAVRGLLSDTDIEAAARRYAAALDAAVSGGEPC